MDKAEKTQTVKSRKRRASLTYSMTSKKSKYEKSSIKTPADITRAEIVRRMQEDPCDPELYGELATSGEFTSAFYKALGSLVSLMPPIECGVNDEIEAMEHLLKEAMNQLRMIQAPCIPRKLHPYLLG